MIHENIPTFKVFVRKEFLYDMDATFMGELVPGEVFAISSYPQEALTFQVLLHDGCLFSYIPIQALQMHSCPIANPLSLQELVYKDSPGTRITVKAYALLQGEIIGYFRRSKSWIKGRYILTVDWYQDNEQFHLVELQNGQLALLPNHKIKFKAFAESFPNYRKLHQTWKVDAAGDPTST